MEEQFAIVEIIPNPGQNFHEKFSISWTITSRFTQLKNGWSDEI